MFLASEIDRELYPESDGKPMADNTIQYRWIVTIKENLERLFADEPNVFVAADLLWYPVRRLHSQPKEERVEPQAPDVMVVLGVPKGDRGSYIQPLENNIAPQVAFEIHSRSNKRKQRQAKFAFYEKYGIEEYYYYNPYKNVLDAWLRREDALEAIALTDTWVSPRLGIRFELGGETLRLFYPNGEPFASFGEACDRAARAETERFRAEAEKAREKERAALERRQREQAEVRADRAEAEKVLAEGEKRQEKERADRLAAKLRALGIDPEEV